MSPAAARPTVRAASADAAGEAAKGLEDRQKLAPYREGATVIPLLEAIA